MISKHVIGNIVTFVLTALLLTGAAVEGRADIISKNQTKTLIIIGDSRCCAIVSLLDHDSDYQRQYLNIDDKRADAIFTKNGTNIVICAEGGGSLHNGAVNDAINRMVGLMYEHPKMLLADRQYFFNLYGVNDLGSPATFRRKLGASYLKLDKDIRLLLPELDGVYQFNIGPVDDNAYFALHGIGNSKIELTNAGFKSDADTEVVDLYGYLCNAGFATEDDTAQYGYNTGLHYDDVTTAKIVTLIDCLTQQAELKQLMANGE